jgi:hypothetical protein
MKVVKEIMKWDEGLRFKGNSPLLSVDIFH